MDIPYLNFSAIKNPKRLALAAPTLFTNSDTCLVPTETSANTREVTGAKLAKKYP